ncbi:MAG: 50S ribosomal protein L1 [Chloroflexi bacterium]|nr:50S ribosomal protein L1 [Chloroflexota bacterium]
MAKHGKRYRLAISEFNQDEAYSPGDAIALVKKMAGTKFDETVELHLRTNADPRHAEQMVRGVTTLPHGLGKPQRVLVFAQGDAARQATEAGADYVGDDDLIERIEGGWVEFDIAVATPDMMSRIGKLGRVLGRRGLMPNPRTGTVVQPQDVGKAVDEAKGGRVEFRTDRTAIIHCAIGKASFDEDKLVGNMAALMDAINQNRPTAIKGQFVQTAFLTSTMGPSVRLDVASTVGMTGA